MRAGDERDLADDRPADGVSRARAQGRVRRRAGGADSKDEKDSSYKSPTSMPSAARPTGPSNGSARRCNTATPGSPRSSRRTCSTTSTRPALAAVPAQDRQGAGATRRDQVRCEGAEVARTTASPAGAMTTTKKKRAPTAKTPVRSGCEQRPRSSHRWPPRLSSAFPMATTGSTS